jgi:N-acetylglucosamine kinase-like BadF-type ATPase
MRIGRRGCGAKGCGGLPFFFAVAVAVVGGAMAEEESGGTKETGTSVAIERVKGFDTLRRLIEELAKQASSEIAALCKALIEAAKKGNLPALKMVLDLLAQAAAGVAVSEAEQESLSMLLVREFQVWDEENGKDLKDEESDNKDLDKKG